MVSAGPWWAAKRRRGMTMMAHHDYPSICNRDEKIMVILRWKALFESLFWIEMTDDVDTKARHF
jgi:hypothetical protein